MHKKLDLYLSIDWIYITKFLLINSKYDGWGWEFLMHAEKNKLAGCIVAHLFKKMNKNFKCTNVTEKIESDNLDIYQYIPHLNI